MADDDVTSASSSTLKVDGAKYDLNALFGFTVLQDLLRSLSKQQDHQLELIQQLREDLEAEKRNGEEVAKRLKAEIDLKATEKALTALALETSRDKTAMQKKHETFESEVSKKFAKHEQRLETQQSKLYDCKVSLDTKAETRTLDALTTRVDGCATAVELADAKLALRSATTHSTAQRALTGCAVWRWRGAAAAPCSACTAPAAVGRSSRNAAAACGEERARACTLAAGVCRAAAGRRVARCVTGRGSTRWRRRARHGTRRRRCSSRCTPRG
jgi:hypothetical protein